MVKKLRNRRRRGRRMPRRRSRYGANHKVPHRFARWETTDREIDLTGAGTPNEQFGAYTFNLDQLQNSSELTNLYDKYRLKYVKLYINWTPFTGGAFPPTNATSPILSYVRDYDDDAPPTEAVMRSRADTRQLRLIPNKIHTIFIKPAVLTTLYKSALSSGYAPKWGVKVDMANSDLPHYGLKWHCKGMSGVNMGKVNIRIKHYVECYTQR